MIKSVRIKGYKSFRNMEIKLRPLSVIFGPNASGKSNFLDSLYLVSRSANHKNLKEAFEGHRGLPLESFFYGDEGYEGLSKRSQIEFTFEIDVEISPSVIKNVEETILAKRKGIDSEGSRKKIISEPLLRYRLKIQAMPKTGYLMVMDERLCAIKENGQEKSRVFLQREGNRIHLRMEGQAHPTFHEVGLDHTIVSMALYEPHYPHITALRSELANWYTFYLEPKILMRQDVPLAEIHTLGSRGENLAAFLNTLKHKYERDFEDFNLALRRILPTDARIEVEHMKEGLVGLRLSENGLWFSARLISEGTLRLIGLLAAIHPKNPATMIAFEEPENGVHPVRLEIISEVLKNAVKYGKQIMITTHSPILPKFFDVADLFICSKEKNQSTIRPYSEWGPLFRNHTIESALDDRILRGDFGG
ncbi:MAG: AAA family ATPase [bacterium]